MTVKQNRLFPIFLGSITLFLFISFSLNANILFAQTPTHSCFATFDDGTTVFSSSDATAVQQAIDAVPANDTIKIAGTCAGTQERSGITQTAYISKSISIAGGYQSDDWTQSTGKSTLDGTENGRVLYLTQGITVSLSNLIIQNGMQINQPGAGIYVAGTNENRSNVTLTNVLIQDNRTLGFLGNGGGISTRSTVINIVNSAVINNRSAAGGGGISVLRGGSTLNIQNSTIYSNTARESGGAILSSAVINMANTTLSHNHAQRGGALLTLNLLQINNSTIVSNTSNSAAGGIFGESSTMLRNSIVAGNMANGALENCSGSLPFTSDGHNISDGDCDGFDGALNDQTFTDPQLSMLMEVNGEVPFHYPQVTSPVIDAAELPVCTVRSGWFGTNPLFSTGTILTTDKRGNERFDGDGDTAVQCDIGAVEYVGEIVCTPENEQLLQAHIAIEHGTVAITTNGAGNYQVSKSTTPYDTAPPEVITVSGTYTDSYALQQQEAYYSVNSIDNCGNISDIDGTWLGKFDFSLTPGQ